MRISSLLVGFLGLSLIGCVGVIDGGDPVGGDDDGSGSGSGSGSDPDPLPVPRLDSTIDKTTVDTELGTTHTFKVNLAASGDFSGAVTVAPTAVDASNVPVPGWTVSVDMATVTLATNGTAVVTGTLVVPTENNGLVGTVKFDVSSSLGSEALSAAVTVTNQLTLVVTQNGNGQCVYPNAPTGAVKVGTKVRFLNMGVDNIMIHTNEVAGINHQDTGGAGLTTNTAYERTTTGTGTVQWYCHSPGPTDNQPINVIQ